jgi:hypothetical protein
MERVMTVEQWWDSPKTLVELVEAKQIQFELDIESEKQFLDDLKKEKTITDKEYESALNKKTTKAEDFKWENFIKKFDLHEETLKRLENKRMKLHSSIADKMALVLEVPRKKIYSVIPVDVKGDTMDTEFSLDTVATVNPGLNGEKLPEKVAATITPEEESAEIPKKRRGRPPGSGKKKVSASEISKLSDTAVEALSDTEKNPGLAEKLAKSLRDLADVVDTIYNTKA